MTILGFFAASLTDGKVYIWIVLFFHCLMMAIFFRPKEDKQDSDSSLKISTKWARKSWLDVCLVFTQIFTFIPFNERKQKSKEEPKKGRSQEGAEDTQLQWTHTYIKYFFVV